MLRSSSTGAAATQLTKDQACALGMQLLEVTTRSYSLSHSLGVDRRNAVRVAYRLAGGAENPQAIALLRGRFGKDAFADETLNNFESGEQTSFEALSRG